MTQKYSRMTANRREKSNSLKGIIELSNGSIWCVSWVFDGLILRQLGVGETCYDIVEISLIVINRSFKYQLRIKD